MALTLLYRSCIIEELLDHLCAQDTEMGMRISYIVSVIALGLFSYGQPWGTLILGFLQVHVRSGFVLGARGHQLISSWQVCGKLGRTETKKLLLAPDQTVTNQLERLGGLQIHIQVLPGWPKL